MSQRPITEEERWEGINSSTKENLEIIAKLPSSKDAELLIKNLIDDIDSNYSDPKIRERLKIELEGARVAHQTDNPGRYIHDYTA